MESRFPHVNMYSHRPLRIHAHVVRESWAKACRSSGSSVSRPGHSAFAAVDAGLPTRYIQHGLVRYSLVLPCFDWVDGLTVEEATHFRQCLPSAVVSLQPSASAAMLPATMSRGILIASVYAAKSEMQRVLTFIDWAASRGRHVWVRPHPREDRSFWNEGANQSLFAIEDRDSSFHEALARLRPRLAVSWFSTALADALAIGVIPVSVSAHDDINVLDMVYPLHRRCLHWPDDEARIVRVLDDDDAYLTELERLRRGHDEVSD